MLPDVDYDFEDYEDEDDENGFEEDVLPNLTYKMDSELKIITGMCDDDEALMQALRKILSTELGENIIYDDGYGIEKNDLYGAEIIYIESLLQDRIQEAVLSDDRFSTVDKFSFSKNKNKLLAEFTVTTVRGEEIQMEEGVELDV